MKQRKKQAVTKFCDSLLCIFTIYPNKNKYWPNQLHLKNKYNHK